MDIKDRIKQIIKEEGLSQVDFSEMTGIKTSTLSHVLTGRNNASQEVLQKIIDAFPKYEANWLVNGVGPIVDPEVRSQEARNRTIPLFDNYTNIPSSSASTAQTPINATPHSAQPVATPRKIEKVIVYYDDNTYEVLLPSDQHQ